MFRRFFAAALAAIGFASSAFAQNYNQAIVFGDSTVDSGWWKAWLGAGGSTGNVPKDNLISNSIALGGTGAPVGAGYQMNSQLLASYFGLSLLPADQPGGTNYAISGAKDAVSGGLGNLNPNPLLPSTSDQIANYLAANGGKANPLALYNVSSGGNDITYANDNPGLFPTLAAKEAYLQGQINSLVAEITVLQAAGAKFIVVHDLPGTGTLANFYNQQLFAGLAAAGVHFIPADIQAVIAAIKANPTAFGFTAATVNPGVPGANTGDLSTGSACVWRNPGINPGTNTGWSQWCVNTTTPSNNYAYLASANAQQTYLYADDQHFSAAGQKIEADYIYSLLTAPSEISFLAENAVKTRLALVSSIQTQIDQSLASRGPSGFNAWVTGDVSSISMDNYRFFPGDPNQAVTIAGGFDYVLGRGLIGGLAFSTGSLNSALGTYGSFRQDETSVSVYAAYKAGPFWGSVIGSYGRLDYDVNRNVPIGISIQTNSGRTSGEDWSAAIQGGYKFWNGGITHGPVAGLVYQNVNVDHFTETGSFTSLGFGSQTRESAVGQLGYKASYDWSNIQPFAQVTWNHEFADTNRNVTASLTTIVAPSFSLPAVLLGKDWGEVKGGVAMDIGQGVKFLAVGSADFAQNSATVYGAQIGFNIAF